MDTVNAIDTVEWECSGVNAFMQWMQWGMI